MADFIEDKDLRILILEDVPSDAELEESELRDAGLAFTLLRVDTRDAFERALDEFRPNIVIADYRLPAYSGRDAVEYIRRLHPQIPVVITTGAMGDEAAVELLKLGAKDYVLKDRLARLAPAIKRALSEEKGVRNRKLAEGKYRALFNEAMDGIVLIESGTWLIVECNPEFERQSGRALEQLKKLRAWEVVLPEQQERVQQDLVDIQNTVSKRGKYQMQKPGGEIVPFEYSAKYLNIQQQSFVQVVTRDISERLRAEQALLDSEARYKRITEGLTDYQYTVRIKDGHAVETIQSPACLKVTGYKSEEFAADPNLWIQMVVREDRELVTERLRQVMAGKEVPPIEHRIIRKDGELRWVSDTIILFKDAAGALLSYDGVIRDITERKQAEEKLRETRNYLENLFNHANAPIIVWSPSYQITLFNHAFEHLTGRDASEVIGKQIDILFPVERKDEALAHIYQTKTGERWESVEIPIQHANGSVRTALWNSATLYSADGKTVVATMAQGQDITDRKQAEAFLHRANRALKTLSAANLALVRAASEDELLRMATRVIVEEGGYRLAAVDYADVNPDKSITPMAWSGMGEGQYWAQHLSWADTEYGQLPVSKTIRLGTTNICRDIANDPGFKPWRDVALARGYVSNIALPLAGEGKTFGGLSIYSSEVDAFDDEEVRLLEELASDLAYGVITLRARAEQEKHAAALRESLEQSIQTIAATVEARDPYTAGHQRRVAELAIAIAKEMGLPEERINGVHLAAIIHDLGKIRIPAEILSKPGKLNEIEFMLIKTHPRSGYDIVKDVEFPWPIADIIQQHHEKLDGSGYPLGLKGDQIMLESRILTVADVVEAMSSHRPYRPTLGGVAALSEIERGRGGEYDPAVVDACRRVFVDKGFRFSS